MMANSSTIFINTGKKSIFSIPFKKSTDNISQKFMKRYIENIFFYDIYCGSYYLHLNILNVKILSKTDGIWETGTVPEMSALNGFFYPMAFEVFSGGSLQFKIIVKCR